MPKQKHIFRNFCTFIKKKKTNGLERSIKTFLDSDFIFLWLDSEHYAPDPTLFIVQCLIEYTLLNVW